LHAVRLNFMLDCMPSAHFDMEKTVTALTFAVKYAPAVRFSPLAEHA
jgi:hypothetical protein